MILRHKNAKFVKITAINATPNSPVKVKKSQSLSSQFKLSLYYYYFILLLLFRLRI